MAQTQAQIRDNIPEKFWWCRSHGHSWRPRNRKVQGAGGMIRETLQCPLCRTVRNDVVRATTGIVEDRDYDYPKGYLLPRGMGIHRTDMRAVALRAALDATRRRKKDDDNDG